jgi:hypothetical protein
MRQYRIYYNAKSTAPVVWAIDEGTQGSEVHVQRVEVGPGLGLVSCFNPNHKKGEPSAWFELSAHCEIRGGVAYLTQDTPLPPAELTTNLTSRTQ